MMLYKQVFRLQDLGVQGLGLQGLGLQGSGLQGLGLQGLGLQGCLQGCLQGLGLQGLGKLNKFRIVNLKVRPNISQFVWGDFKQK